jgi:hypothetical protein
MWPIVPQSAVTSPYSAGPAPDLRSGSERRAARHQLSAGWEFVRLSVGAFLTSPGFGGLAAVVGALAAVRVAMARLRGDYAMATQSQRRNQNAAREADARARWWDTLQWLWTNKEEVGEQAFLEGLQSLAAMVETRQQSVMLEIVTNTLTPRGD